MASGRSLWAPVGALAALLAGATAPGCTNGRGKFERFLERYSVVAVVRDGSRLTLLDLRRGESRDLLPEGACGRFPSVLWSPDGSRLLCVGQAGEQDPPIGFSPDPGFLVHQVVQGTTVSLDLVRVDGKARRTIARGTTSPTVTTFFSIDWRPSAL